jgi:hypothetical protein
MNVCAKINSMAPPIGIVMGAHLYYIAKKLSLIDNDYCQFKRIGQYSIAPSFKHQYPVYSVVRTKGVEATTNILKLKEDISRLQNVSYSDAFSRVKSDLQSHLNYRNYPYWKRLGQEGRRKEEKEK